MDSATLLSVAIGGAITWFVAWLYYRRAGSELRNEAAELRRLTAMVLSALEAAGLADLTRDHTGRIAGIAIRGHGSIIVTPPTIQGLGHVTPSPTDPGTGS